jgi:hypothetical protein
MARRCRVVLACLSSAKGEALEAARLFGAAQALRVRESVALQHTPEQDAYREPYLAPNRSQLGDAAWQAAWAEG